MTSAFDFADAFSSKLDALLGLGPAATVPGFAPQPKQLQAQELADDNDVFELLYGGSAGGGKSYWMRADAIRFCLNHPGANVAIVRRTLPMLRKTHHRPLMALCDTLATHNKAELSWSFPNGSFLQLISLTHDGDEQDYKSVEFDRLYFDELTEFLETQYTYMLTRMRSANGHPVTVISASNPEGVGYAWVKRRFISPKPAELPPGQDAPEPMVPWFPQLPDGSGTGLGRVFVPATVLDNPALLAANPQYITQLKAIPDPRKRRALLEGDWDAMDQVPGALWSLETIDGERLREAPDTIVRKVVSVDPAVTAGPTSDETGIVLVGKGMVGDGPARTAHFYVLADASCRVPVDEWARRAVRLAVDNDATLLIEVDQGGDMNARLLREAARELGVPCPTIDTVRAGSEGSKATRAAPVAALYNNRRAHHVGVFEELETQMTTWVPELSRKSPDRIDALVHAVRKLSGNGAVSAPLRQMR